MKRMITAIFVVLCSYGMAQEFSAKTEPIQLTLDANAPEVKWLSPQQDNVVSKDKSLTLELEISSTSPISSVNMFNNGMEIPMSRGISIGGGSSSATTKVEQTVNLNLGMNQITFIIENEEGGVIEVTRNVGYNFEVSDRSDYALIFAVSEYDEWGDLTNPVYDAIAIEGELSEYYGFKTELVINPTRRQILEKIREYAGKSYQPKDQLLVFYAGHGKFDEVTRMGYLAPSDAELDDLVGDSYISHSNLRDYVNRIPCDHTFVMLDACFGGTFDQALAMSGSRGGQSMFYELTRSEFIERKLKYKTRKYLTSGGKEYVPDGRPGAHSPFARKMLEALRNYGGNDKVLTFTELMTYFEALTPQPRSGEFGENEPGSDFIFVAK